jgi:hypothetical protein
MGPGRNLAAEHLALADRCSRRPRRRGEHRPLNTRYTGHEALSILRYTSARVLFLPGRFLRGGLPGSPPGGCPRGGVHTLAALKSIRARRQDGYRIYVIMDNLPANKTPAIRAWADGNNVELCFTPTCASWANPIEAQFGPLRTFVMGGSDHPNHTVLARKLNRPGFGSASFGSMSHAPSVPAGVPAASAPDARGVAS